MMMPRPTSSASSVVARLDLQASTEPGACAYCVPINDGGINCGSLGKFRSCSIIGFESRLRKGPPSRGELQRRPQDGSVAEGAMRDKNHINFQRPFPIFFLA